MIIVITDDTPYDVITVKLFNDVSMNILYIDNKVCGFYDVEHEWELPINIEIKDMV
jgi:hypothetical protein